MDNQPDLGANPEANPPTTNSPPVENQPVIQPATPTSTSPQVVVAAPQSSTTFSSPADPLPQQPIVNGEPVTINKATPLPQMDTIKPKKHWLRFGVIGVVIVAIIGIGVLLTVNSNLRAFVFQERFVNYAFVNDHGYRYSILFYRNSTVQIDSYSAGNEKALTSPVVKPYVTPVVMIIDGHANNSSNTAQQAIVESNNCTFEKNSTEVFKLYIKSLNTYANVCTDQGIVYVTTFGTSQSVYSIIIDAKFNLNQVTESQASNILSHKLDESDIRTIVSSFKPLS